METGCSPYDLARLCDEYPVVFGEWLDLVMDAKEGRAKKDEWDARRERVDRIFRRGR